MSLKDKLNLYKSPQTNQTTSEPVKSPASVETRPILPELKFGDVVLNEIKPGAFLRRLVLKEPSIGSKSLTEYLPLQLTGILELALIKKRELIHPSEVLFLDTETTGLNRGVSNYPFMTGLGYFAGETLVVEQLFLADIGGEEAYLDYLNNLMGGFSYLVSYNGKSFDLPLIRNRLIMNRKTSRAPLMHFDLLHILRRLHPKPGRKGYKQKDMEMALLEFVREGDIPGEEIPQLYFDYKKYDVDGGMDNVFEHNNLDIQGMVFLFLEAIRIYREQDIATPALRSGLARVLARNQRVQEAINILSDEATHDDSARLYLDNLFLAGLFRSRKDWEKSAEKYQEILNNHTCMFSLLTLAKIQEHRLKDQERARITVQRLLTLRNLKKPPEDLIALRKGWTGLYSEEELMKRLQRVEKKLAKA